MSFNAIAAQLREDFTYTADAEQFDRKEHWREGVLNGPFAGDCDDFAMSAGVRLAGSHERFWQMMASGELVIHRVKIRSLSTGKWNGHVILRHVEAGYIDNIDPNWRQSIKPRNVPGDMFQTDRAYSVADVRRKLAGKKVYDRKKVGMVALIGLCVLGLIAFGGVGGLF